MAIITQGGVLRWEQGHTIERIPEIFVTDPNAFSI